MNLLLVEDDEMLAEAVRAGLAQNGWQVDWVADAGAARTVLVVVVIVVRDFETLARDRRQRISLQTEPGMILGDVDQLGILLRNLIDNAVRYAGEGGQIAVSCQPARSGDDHGMRLEVADNGPGVAEEDRTRIFDRFYRAPGSAGRGSGIGLSLVARIAQSHGASVEVGPGLDGRGFAIAVFFESADAV